MYKLIKYNYSYDYSWMRPRCRKKRPQKRSKSASPMEPCNASDPGSGKLQHHFLLSLTSNGPSNDSMISTVNFKWFNDSTEWSISN